ncbi:hypothetical protein ACLK19_08975 [Escherichia coli]
MVRFSRYPAKPGSVNLTLPVDYRRSVVWRTSNGTGYTIASRRFVSADQLPLIVLEITISPLNTDASVLI